MAENFALEARMNAADANLRSAKFEGSGNAVAGPSRRDVLENNSLATNGGSPANSSRLKRKGSDDLSDFRFGDFPFPPGSSDAKRPRHS